MCTFIAVLIAGSQLPGAFEGCAQTSDKAALDGGALWGVPISLKKT